MSEQIEGTFLPSQAEKRFTWNGRRKIDLRHLAGLKKWRPFLEYLHDLYYEEDFLTHEDCFYKRKKGFVFEKVVLPEKLVQVLKEKCLAERMRRTPQSTHSPIETVEQTTTEVITNG